MDCPNCGAGLGERKAFCTRCGTAVLTTCDSCGGQNPRAAQFCGDCGAKLQDRPPVDIARRPVQPARPVPPPSPPTVERRQLTVMFCDLVGSTALSTRLDLEDLHDAITAYQSCVDEIVGQFDGFVARHLGDGILIFFGYPLAQEDDAERAVRAGLAIVESVAALRVPDAAMQVRVGIATGTVVIGEFVSAQATQRPDVIGEAPNLAARLQSIAEPDTVLIADATRRLVGSLFEDRDLGRTTLKGFTDDVQVWQVLRPRAIRNRF
jgi:class 3 adenylate cyclase